MKFCDKLLINDLPLRDLNTSSVNTLVEKGLVGSIQNQRHTGSIIQSVIDSIDG